MFQLTTEAFSRTNRQAESASNDERDEIATDFGLRWILKCAVFSPFELEAVAGGQLMYLFSFVKD